MRRCDFSNQRLQDVQRKEVRYEECSLSASTIERGYFHRAKFVDCKFTGTRFVNSIFRSATFENCDFSYADFDRCVLPVPQVLANPARRSSISAQAASAAAGSRRPRICWIGLADVRMKSR